MHIFPREACPFRSRALIRQRIVELAGARFLRYCEREDPVFTKREFISSAITVAGGLALFSFPTQAHVDSAMASADSSVMSDSISSKTVTSVVPLGIYAQTLLGALYPDALASLAKGISPDAADFTEAGLADAINLAETGTPGASFGQRIDPKQLAALSPNIAFQAGVPHEGTAKEIERIQAESSIPCVFLDISFGRLQESYRALGRLLGCEERAEELASYIEGAQSRAVAAMADGGREFRVFYGPRAAGKKVTAGVSVQVDVMSRLGLAPVTRPYDFEGRTVDFAALAEEDPDFIVLDDTSLPSAFFSCEGEAYELWKGVRAVGEGRFAVAPALMHSILGSAVFAQSIGMLWMVYATAPQGCDLSMPTEMQKFYETFYGLKRSKSAMAMSLGEECEHVYL